MPRITFNYTPDHDYNNTASLREAAPTVDYSIEFSKDSTINYADVEQHFKMWLKSLGIKAK
jgi:hypothetical protein